MIPETREKCMTAGGYEKSEIRRQKEKRFIRASGKAAEVQREKTVSFQRDKFEPNETGGEKARGEDSHLRQKVVKEEGKEAGIRVMIHVRCWKWNGRAYLPWDPWDPEYLPFPVLYESRGGQVERKRQ